MRVKFSLVIDENPARHKPNVEKYFLEYEDIGGQSPDALNTQMRELRGSDPATQLEFAEFGSGAQIEFQVGDSTDFAEKNKDLIGFLQLLKQKGYEIASRDTDPNNNPVQWFITHAPAARVPAQLPEITAEIPAPDPDHIKNRNRTPSRVINLKQATIKSEDTYKNLITALDTKMAPHQISVNDNPAKHEYELVDQASNQTLTKTSVNINKKGNIDKVSQAITNTALDDAQIKALTEAFLIGVKFASLGGPGADQSIKVELNHMPDSMAEKIIVALANFSLDPEYKDLKLNVAGIHANLYADNMVKLHGPTDNANATELPATQNVAQRLVTEGAVKLPSIPKHPHLRKTNEPTADNPQTKHINCDRAYYLEHNIAFLLNDLAENGKSIADLDQMTRELLEQAQQAIAQYRAETRANFNAHIDEIEDGRLDKFWQKLEAGNEGIAQKIQKLNEDLWHQLVLREQTLDQDFKMHDKTTALVYVDGQKDFSRNAPDGKLLAVTDTEQISATRKHMLGITNGALVVDTRDMHSTHDCQNACCGHGSIWDKANDWPMPNDWTPPHPLPNGISVKKENGQFLVHIKNDLTIPGTPLPQIVQDAYPKAGGAYWGNKGHCKRNTPGSDHVVKVPIHPNAVHVIKGTTPDLHQYGGGNVNGFNVAEYLEKAGAKIAILTGWATNFCVGETGREILLSNLNKGFNLLIMAIQNCLGGVVVENQIKHDDNSEADVKKCFVGEDELKVTAKRMGLNESIIDTNKCESFTSVIDGKDMQAVYENIDTLVSNKAHHLPPTNML